jgi:hypothetical protein
MILCRFLEKRFNPPPGTNSDGAPVDDLDDEEQDDIASLRNVSGTVRRQTPDGNSVYSVGSDQQSAMYDYQSSVSFLLFARIDEVDQCLIQ